jgi:hypothetical protein
MSSITGILQRMEEVLRKHRETSHADLVARLAAEADPHRFAEEIGGLEIWGGQGALVDVTLPNSSDDRELNELIVDLAEALDQLGLGNPRSRWVAQTIEDWLIAHPTIK